MKIAYIRPTIDDDNNRDKLEQLNELGYDKLFIEGDVGKKKPLTVLDKVVALAVQGDVVCITTLTQLGRSLEEIVRFAKLISDKQVAVFSITENTEKKHQESDLNIKLLASLAVEQRIELVARIQAGRKAAAERGVQLGRKKGLSSKYASIAPEVFAYAQQPKKTIPDILTKFNIGSRNTLYKILDFQREAIGHQNRLDARKRKIARAPAQKLFYMDIETTGDEPILDSIHHLGLILEINGEIALRDSLIVRPQEYDDLPEDYQTPGTRITKAQLGDKTNFVPAAEALTELCQILGKHIDPVNPADRFLVVGFDSQGLKLPFLKKLFESGPQRFEDYFFAPSFDVLVLAAYYLWPRLAQLGDFTLHMVFSALSGNEKVRMVQEGGNGPDVAVGVEMTRQVYKHITADGFVFNDN